MDNNKKKVSAADVVNEQDKARKAEKYNQYVKEKTPTHNKIINFFNAYWVGGAICILGQALNNYYSSLGCNKDQAGGYTSLTLILLSVILTGFNLYSKLAKFAGAGTVVPITGFANSVAAPAVEFKKEGQVFGIGCKIFTIAGPVILYGVFSSWVLGLIYYILMKMGIVS